MLVVLYIVPLNNLGIVISIVLTIHYYISFSRHCKGSGSKRTVFRTNWKFVTNVAQKVTWQQLVFMVLKCSIYIVLSIETLKV